MVQMGTRQWGGLVKEGQLNRTDMKAHHFWPGDRGHSWNPGQNHQDDKVKHDIIPGRISNTRLQGACVHIYVSLGSVVSIFKK